MPKEWMGLYQCHTKITIDLDAIAHNVGEIRGMGVPGIIPVVKFDAYGAGMRKIVQMLKDCGCSLFAVGDVAEASALRKMQPDIEMMQMQPGLDEDLNLLVEYGVWVPLCSCMQAEALEKFCASRRMYADVQIRVDCSDSLLGVKPEDFLSLLGTVQNSEYMRLRGIFTHIPGFYSAVGDEGFAQLSAFKRLLRQTESLPQNCLIHAASTAGLRCAQAWFDAVRVGTGLYGLPDFPGQKLGNMHECLSITTRVLSVGTSEEKLYSYRGPVVGCGYRRVAVLAAGYGNLPYLRGQHTGEVLIGGRRCPVLICQMGHIVAGLPDGADASTGDEAVLIGQQDKEHISVQEAAKMYNVEFVGMESLACGAENVCLSYRSVGKEEEKKNRCAI